MSAINYVKAYIHRYLQYMHVLMHLSINIIPQNPNDSALGLLSDFGVFWRIVCQLDMALAFGKGRTRIIFHRNTFNKRKDTVIVCREN